MFHFAKALSFLSLAIFAGNNIPPKKNFIFYECKKIMDTREQKIARSIDRWISLTANAGSGKTRVLVNRYCDIILSGTDPSEIVAITFTKKAASEMISRVTALIETEERRPENSSARIKKLRRIRERLTGARISTIHSFCSSLLRDYPIEADVDPNFIDIPETEQFRLIMESIDRVIEDTLEFADNEKKDGLKQLLKIHVPGRLAGLIYEFISGTEDFRQADSGKIADEDIFKRRNELFNRLYISNISTGMLLLDKNLSIIANGGYHPGYKEKIADLSANVKKIIDMFDKISSPPDEKIISDIFILLETILASDHITKDDGISRRYLRKIVIEDFIEYSSMQDNIRAARKALEIFQNFEFDEKLIAHRNAFFDISRQAIDLYSEKKSENGYIDYSDMLVKAHVLLKDKLVASEIRKGIKYLLVDEFQDTNKIQYEIIKLLAPGNFAGSTLGVNLFVVGDEKQSIYGFRNADVRIFLQAAMDIAEVNRKMLGSEFINPDFQIKNELIPALSKEESTGNLKLSSTFRLQPVIASFTNIVCSEIMKSNYSSYDVIYSDFICGRNTKNVITQNGFCGSIDMLINFEEDTDTNKEYNPEAVLLARKIMAMVNNDIIDEKGVSRKIRFGDVAVLLRSRTKLDELTDAFRKEKIPFAVHSGRGFFDSPEIRDIISFLKFITDNHDDLALSAILKSPYFSFDDTLMLIISGIKGETLYQKMINIEINILPNENHKKMIVRAREILREIISIADEMTITELIADILEKTAWYATTVRYESCPQMYANIDKLSAWARKFEKRGFNTIYDFLYDTDMLTKIGSDESEAMTFQNSEIVNIMTIHASKGLEFPVVAIFDSNSENNRTDSLIQTDELGLSFKINNNSNRIEFPVDPAIHLLNKEIEKTKNHAEAKRLLYVAMTRAEDRLIISATIKNKLKGSLELIFKNKFLRNLNLETLTENVTKVEITDNLKLLVNNQIETHPVRYPITITKYIENSTDTTSPVKSVKQGKFSFRENKTRGFLRDIFPE